MKPTDLYRVFVDSQGVAYLRVEVLENRNTRFAMNLGSSVDLIEMDPKTFKSRALTEVDVEATEVAKKLLLPLSKSVIISPRASTVLKSIVENKEILEMEKQKKEAHRSAKKATPKVEKKSAAAKAAKTSKPKSEATRTRVDDGAKLVLVVKENPRREGTLAFRTYELYAKAKTVADFKAACAKHKADPGYLKGDIRRGYVKLG